MANTYTWNVGNGTVENAANWTPSGFELIGGGTTQNDSLLFGNSNGGNPYAATYGLFGTDEFFDLTVNYAGATVAGDPSTGGFQLTVDHSIQVQSGTLDLGDFTEIVNGGAAASLSVSGVLKGTGLIDAGLPALAGTGKLLALNENDIGIGNILAFGDEVGGGLTGEVATGGTIEFGAKVDTGFALTVDDAANGEIVLDDLPEFNGLIGGLGVGTGANSNPGSFIDLTGVSTGSITGVSFSGGVLTVSAGANGGSIKIAGDYSGDFVNYAADGNGGTNLFFSNTVCFAAGTDILTPCGDVPVETIKVGDQVIAVVDGQRVAKPVKWVGYRRLELDRHAKSAGLAPIRIKRGAMGDGLPARDLLVSQPHCMFIDGKLIPAKLLVNDMTIVHDSVLKTVEYYHIELDRHAVLIAEGVETESYLDTGNRAFFSNGGLALMLHPEFHINAGLRCWAEDACAPLAVSPAAVLPSWRTLADRAVALGHTPPVHATTTDADIHLLADGQRIDTIAVKGQVHSFMVPAGVRSLILGSRSVRPNMLMPYLDDPREIGVAVRSVVLRGLTGRAEFPADHPALSLGWHAPERAGAALWRWTTGNGALPADAVDGPVVVEVTIAETTTYLIDPVPFHSRMAA
jgi:antigen 43